MKKIILDTNFLLIPYQFKVDIFSEIRRICSFRYNLCIIDKTIDELKKIIKIQKGKDRKAAILALVMLDQKKPSVIKTKGEKNVDELIVENSGRDTIVATQDRILKTKLKKA
ncbi:nucleotide-binding protein, partial [Candidatus Woesearchaeota archaeon]|nr:nucleotide-binding protein [Candidatus Woesearchaeota archaeon]